jgi:hypothetical protein
MNPQRPTIHYSLFTPFKTGKGGGTVFGIERKQAKRLLKHSTKEKRPDWMHERLRRYVTLTKGRRMMIYMCNN